ncbi:MAG: hypothetical protein Q9188_002642 [Gyalolechia gomerana]
MLEEQCPQLYGVDKEIWISLIHRDVPNATIIPPKNPQLWWKVYRKMQREHEIEVEKDAAHLKAAFSGIKSAKDKRQILIKEGVPHIPKLDGMQFAHCAEYNKAEYKRYKKKPLKKIAPTALRFEAGSKTKVLTGKGVLDKARREAQDMDRFKSQSPLSVPTHKLSSVATQVREAPKYLVEEFKKPSPPKPFDPTVPRPTMFVPPKRRAEEKDARRPSGNTTIEERERRLRALTNPDTAKKTTTTTSSSTASMPPGSSAKDPSFSTSATTSYVTKTPLPLPKSECGIKKASPAASSTPSSTLKRKAEDLPTAPSIEVDASGIPNNRSKANPSPPRYKVPRLTRSPETPGVRPPKKKAQPDPFMPARKKRIS